MLKLKQSSFFTGILVCIVVLSLFTAFLHHHTGDHSHGHECPACRLVQTLSLILFSAAAVLVIQPVKNRKFAFVSETSFQSRQRTSSLKDRAPPADFSF